MSQQTTKGWRDVIGHERRLELLDRFLVHENMPHSYVFVGPKGVGKSLIALEMAKKLLCVCSGEGTCSCCRSENGQDILGLFYLDGLLPIQISKIRELRLELQNSDMRSGWRVVVIDEAQNLSNPAANAILKILEEPGQKIVFIFVVNNLKRLISTIVSRSVVLQFDRLDEVSDKNWQSQIGTTDESWPYIGVPAVTKKLAGQSIPVHEANVLAFWAMLGADCSWQLNFVKKIANLEKDRIFGLFFFWESCLRDYLLWKSGVNRGRWWHSEAIDAKYKQLNFSAITVLDGLSRLSELRNTPNFNWSTKIQILNWLLSFKTN